MITTLSEAWSGLVQKFFALNKRERWMIMGAIACVFYALFSALVSPMLTRQKMLAMEIANHQTKLEAFNLELNGYAHQAAIDPDLPQKQKVVALEKNLNLLKIEVDGLKNTLIKPERMPDLLSDLLKDNPQLTLISLKTLPTRGLFEDATENLSQKKNNNEDLPIFKHGVEMTIEGRYLDLLDYVATVEKMPWHVLWESAALSVDEKQNATLPLSQLTVKVYTLSLDKTWLSI